jgi:undecaprenyl-phosphate galactose phosphotransferase/putative colanic acid biosynthesis UDP-glucose lipid carrier transferase
MFPRWQRAIAKRKAIARDRWLTRSIIRGLDLAIVIPAIVVLTPLLASLALIVRRDGPTFYRQMRVGRGGRAFSVYRFRTLPIADPGMEVAPASIGLFIRRCSLDELPQLFNVFRGEMSFAGLRPTRSGSPREKPGLTGIDLYSPHVRQGEAKGIRGIIKLYFKVLALTVWFVLVDDWRSNDDQEFLNSKKTMR